MNGIQKFFIKNSHEIEDYSNSKLIELRRSIDKYVKIDSKTMHVLWKQHDRTINESEYYNVSILTVHDIRNVLSLALFL